MTHRNSLPTALMCLTLAAPLQAQTVLTDPAPGTSDVTVSGTLPELTEQTEQNFGQTDVPATDIIRELAPIVGGNPGAPRDVQTRSGTVTMDASRAIDLTVFFAYDSATILPEARAQLDALGHALNDPELLPYGFLIAGHTDARGPAAYNLDLSVRRALAVADYLIRYHRISPNRLVAHGWGETYLRVPSDPSSGANRRVEVSLLLPQQSGGYIPPHEHTIIVPVTEHAAINPTVTYSWLPRSSSRLSDPRWRLSSSTLDDFHATPTYPRY